MMRGGFLSDDRKVAPYQNANHQPRRKTLEAYRDRHLNGLRLGRITWYLAPSFWFFGVLAAVGWWILLPHSPVLGWLIIGGCAGSLLRDISYLQSTSSLWPVFEQIIDWPKVDRMIADAEKSDFDSPLLRP